MRNRKRGVTKTPPFYELLCKTYLSHDPNYAADTISRLFSNVQRLQRYHHVLLFALCYPFDRSRGIQVSNH
ncbi:MAG: hypothetical protein IMW92_02180 [Bacillales bacterium]|nr:hypothetical protein [Bacillales bacterium]